MADAARISALQSALDRARVRARIAVDRGDWADAGKAAADAERAEAELAAARASGGDAGNVVGRRFVRG